MGSPRVIDPVWPKQAGTPDPWAPCLVIRFRYRCRTTGKDASAAIVRAHAERRGNKC